VLARELARMHREGVLGIGAVSHHLQDELLTQSTKTIDAYQQRIADLTLRSERVALQFEAHNLELEDVSPALFVDAHGQHVAVILLASRVMQRGRVDEAKWHHIFEPYVTHLLLNQQQPTTTYIVDQAGEQLELVPLPITEYVTNALDSLLMAVARGLREQLEMECRIGMHWLSVYHQAVSGSKPRKDGTQNNPGVTPERAMVRANEVLQAYDVGGHQQRAIRDQAMYCGRICKDAEALRSSASFAWLIEQVYAPCYQLINTGLPLLKLPEPAFAAEEQHDD